MPTTVVSTIGSDGGDDYSTLASWWTAKQGDLVTDDEIQVAELRGEEHDVGTAMALNMANADATTDATRYYIIRTMSGAEFTGDMGDLSSVARIKNNMNGTVQSVITCNVPYTRFEDFSN